MSAISCYFKLIILVSNYFCGIFLGIKNALLCKHFEYYDLLVLNMISIQIRHRDQFSSASVIRKLYLQDFLQVDIIFSFGEGTISIINYDVITLQQCVRLHVLHVSVSSLQFKLSRPRQIALDSFKCVLRKL